jgi:hypothetical protein
MVYDEQAWKATVKNGQIPASRLAYIWPEQFDPDLNGPARMQPEAALAMGAMLRQAWEDGADDLRVLFSYRTLAKQKEKYRIYQSGGNLAATPGTSNHGWAIACDLTGLGPDELRWLAAHSRKYGYDFPVPGENWHAQYNEKVWGGSELTEDEKKMLTWLEGFKAGSTENLPGLDTGPAMGRALAEGAKHAEKFHVSKKHTHVEGTSGPGGADKHTHAEGTTGPSVEQP